MEGPSFGSTAQRLILRRFVVLQFELQRFVVEKLELQRPIPQRFIVLQSLSVRLLRENER
jgi:hypothetical protein